MSLGGVEAFAQPPFPDIAIELENSSFEREMVEDLVLVLNEEEDREVDVVCNWTIIN